MKNPNVKLNIPVLFGILGIAIVIAAASWWFGWQHSKDPLLDRGLLVSCAQITDAKTCYDRDDCLAIDKCGCQNMQIQKQRCAVEAKDVIRCECAKGVGGFERCATLTCPATDSNKSSTPCSERTAGVVGPGTVDCEYDAQCKLITSASCPTCLDVTYRCIKNSGQNSNVNLSNTNASTNTNVNVADIPCSQRSAGPGSKPGDVLCQADSRCQLVQTADEPTSGYGCVERNSAQSCAEITTAAACTARNDCIAKNQCACMEQAERGQKCGDNPSIVCQCDVSKFMGCENLFCPLLKTNLNTNGASF